MHLLVGDVFVNLQHGDVILQGILVEVWVDDDQDHGIKHRTAVGVVLTENHA